MPYSNSMNNTNTVENTVAGSVAYEARDFKVTRLMPGFEIFNKRTKRYEDVAAWTDAVAHITVEREARRAIRRS